MVLISTDVRNLCRYYLNTWNNIGFYLLVLKGELGLGNGEEYGS